LPSYCFVGVVERGRAGPRPASSGWRLGLGRSRRLCEAASVWPLSSPSRSLRETPSEAAQVSVQQEQLKTALADRYSIVRELGRGGMATVYLATDLKHHREVAVKVMHPELSAVLGVERFLREIHIAAKLNHPHIVPLHDSGRVEAMVFYVMPYVRASHCDGSWSVSASWVKKMR
jgi:serine/threonine protein kinase